MKSETIKSILIAALLCVDVYEEHLRRGLKHELDERPKLESITVTNFIVDTTTNSMTPLTIKNYDILKRLEKLERRQNLYFTNHQLIELKESP